jgi:hypothetical protein
MIRSTHDLRLYVFCQSPLKYFYAECAFPCFYQRAMVSCGARKKGNSMKEKDTYESYPVPIVILAVLVSISVYTIGAYILFGLGIWFFIAYILYCIWMEFRLLKYSCVNCYYYGKLCGLGRGILCPILFKKGEPQRFGETEISWRDLVPDFLVSILPAIGGIFILIRGFSWLILLLLVVLLVLSFGGNAIIRGSFACKYCKQREIGCPAERLFSKESQTV